MDTVGTALDLPPVNSYAAAVWLRDRHPWLDEVVTGVCGPADDGEHQRPWVDQLVDGFNDLVDTDDRWAEYENGHPTPTDDVAYARWLENGPQHATMEGAAIAPLPSVEKRLLRLMTTLSRHERCHAGWVIDDVDFDDRGAAVVEDWLKIVAAQLSQRQTVGPA